MRLLPTIDLSRIDRRGVSLSVMWAGWGISLVLFRALPGLKEGEA